jgi:VWFA-related protein
MRRAISLSVPAVLVLVLVGGAAPSGQSTAPADKAQSLTARATAILVDIVVRDRNGRPVLDLVEADFAVAEDGVAQKIDSFTRVTQGRGIGVSVAWRSPERTTVVSPPASSGASSAAPSSEAADSTTAIVFAHLSSESLRLAQRATLDYIPMSGDSPVRVGVFAADPSIRVLQRYTNDRTRVRKAIANIAPSGTSAEEQKSDRADELLARRRQLWNDATQGTGGAATGAGLAPAGADVGRREAELQQVEQELDMIRSFEQIDREHRGYDVSQGLQGVIESLVQYPGRKSIVFFSEGLPVSPALSARLDSLIDAANRANVTTYAVDAHGLRAKSSVLALQKEVDTFAEERMVQNQTGITRTERPLTMSLERVEDTLKLDSRSGLARLASDTGGFLIEGSNDLSAAFRRIDEDNQFHYLLTYSPTNTALDGKFRAIQVKVRRPGVQVFARKGYRALATPRPTDTSFEAPALALLDRGPLPNAFPIYAAGFTFPEAKQPGLTPLLVRVSAATLRFDVDAQRSTYSAQAAIVMRVRDAQGGEAQRFSQQYLLTGHAQDIDAAKRGEILFYRQTDLAPGVYTVESIVFDPLAQAGSARLATITVPAASSSPFSLSSLVIVSRFEDLREAPGGSEPTAPLYVGRTLLYPNLGEPVSLAVANDLPFYFAVYGAAPGLSASAQLIRNGQVLADAPFALPESSGPRVQHVGRLPIGALPAGTYELRIKVTDGSREQSRSAFFTLQK